MDTIDLVLTKYCPACKWSDVILRQPSPPPGLVDRVPKYEGIAMSIGRSKIELRTDLRFICCEHCGNPVQYLRVEAKSEPPVAEK
jgi:hypothetical protein